MPALLTTSLPSLPPPRKGKVREVYDMGADLLIVSTDRLSAFDVIMANGVPDKGRILNKISAFWFEKLSRVCPNHILAVDDDEVRARLNGDYPELRGRCTIARKAQPLAIECVVRGYIAGSLFKEYKARGGQIHGLNLPDGLQDGDRLPEPIFTPATKAESGHDQNISFGEAARIVGRQTAEQARDWSLEIYRQSSEFAATKNLILADTKFEFGLTDSGLIWIDEALSPDSSRFWEAAGHRPGGAQPSFDKQFVRDYLESIGWDKQPPGPLLPQDIIDQTRAKYLAAFERITGNPLVL